MAQQSPSAVRRSRLVKERERQLEALMLVRARIEHRAGAGADALHLGRVVLAKPAPLVQAARMREHVAAACLVNVEANHLLADRTLGGDRVKSPPSQQLYELHYPYGNVPHGLSSQIQTEENTSI
jgi:hypothetical protein